MFENSGIDLQVLFKCTVTHREYVEQSPDEIALLEILAIDVSAPSPDCKPNVSENDAVTTPSSHLRPSMMSQPNSRDSDCDRPWDDYQRDDHSC